MWLKTTTIPASSVSLHKPPRAGGLSLDATRVLFVNARVLNEADQTRHPFRSMTESHLRRRVVPAALPSHAIRRSYLLRATRRAGGSSGWFDRTGASPICGRPFVSASTAMTFNLLRSTLLSALRGNSSSIPRASGTL
jgi:hypothetical protein